MIISQLTNPSPLPAVPKQANPGPLSPNIYRLGNTRTASGKSVSAETAKRVATVYRCANVISDDIAMMPLQVYRRFQGQTSRVFPNTTLRNTAYLLERRPNRWTADK